MARLCPYTCIYERPDGNRVQLPGGLLRSDCALSGPDVTWILVDVIPKGRCCGGWQNTISGTRADEFSSSVFSPTPGCTSHCGCLGFGDDVWGQVGFYSFKYSCSEVLSLVHINSTQRRNMTNVNTWHEHQDSPTTHRGTGNFGCPRVGACCIDKDGGFGGTDLRQCRLFTARGCAGGIYQGSRFIFHPGGVFMGTSVECKCTSYTSDPSQAGPNFPDSVYSKCVGIGNEFEVGNANDACANTGACCFDDCCTRATRELCRSLGGRSHINAGCTTACPEANCREALFELAVEDGIKPDNDFRELGLAGYMVPQSNVEIPLGIKTAVDGRFGDEFEGVDPYPDTNFFETICGYWTGNTILDDNNYVVLEACNNQRLTSGDQRSTELDAVQDDNGYAHFGGGFTKPEQSRCHGIGPIT